jgi:hypothetical protein
VPFVGHINAGDNDLSVSKARVTNDRDEVVHGDSTRMDSFGQRQFTTNVAIDDLSVNWKSRKGDNVSAECSVR